MDVAGIVTRVIDEQLKDGHRLGRHVEHDPASRAYAAQVVPGVQLQAVKHARHGSLFNQLRLGSCTGNAAAGAVNTDPVHHAKQALLHEKDAVGLYSKATTLDNVPGSYPPDDTGSTGLAVAKAAKLAGYISAYQHAFSVDAALQALQASAFIMGVDWYEGFDTPDPNTGIIAIAGQVRGGHEFLCREYAPQHTNTYLDDILGCDNSWGTGWGLHGRMYMTVRTYAALMHTQGDTTILLP